MDTLTRPTQVTIAEGHEVRVYAQTASRDYTARAVPGTYPIEYTDINFRPVTPGERPYYGLIRIQIDSPERRESSVEWGGVPLASRTVPASRDRYLLMYYGYQLEGDAHTARLESPTFTFGY